MRQTVAKQYNEALKDLVETPFVPEHCTSVWAQYSVLSDRRDDVQAALKEHGIPSVVYYPVPCHLATAYADLGYKHGDMPVSEQIAEQIFSLPMHPYIEEGFAEQVANVVRGALT